MSKQFIPTPKSKSSTAELRGTFKDVCKHVESVSKLIEKIEGSAGLRVRINEITRLARIEYMTHGDVGLEGEGFDTYLAELRRMTQSALRLQALRKPNSRLAS